MISSLEGEEQAEANATRRNIQRIRIQALGRAEGVRVIHCNFVATNTAES